MRPQGDGTRVYCGGTCVYAPTLYIVRSPSPVTTLT